MLIQENVQNISLLVNKLFDFVKTDADIQQDIQAYLSSLPEKITTQAELQSVLLPYVFERIIENSGKKLIDVYIEKNPSLSQDELEVLNGLKKSILSIFEIKKVLNNGFELYNLVNEKEYNTLTLVKMVHFRGVTAGQFVIGRIFPLKNENYLIEIDNVYPEKSQDQAYKFAVMKQLESPELLYMDNEVKLAEIQKTIDNMTDKFKEYFGKNEFLTTTEYVDDLLGSFNDYVENPDLSSNINLDDYIKVPEQFAYYDVREVTSGSFDIMDTVSKGFASHEKVYDVGVIFDSSMGLLVLPFYGTFMEIFRTEDPKSIEGFKDCILNYFNSERVPPLPIMNAYNENPEKFKKIVSEVLELDHEINIEKLLHEYKSEYFAKRRFSSPTVLYSSKAFSVLMENADKAQATQFDKKVGRNDPCPCGSGKKYKKCCLNGI
ncbi:MAG: SEC-C metal-binding domain-containing protein [Candidatus Gastranaerophilales bacterium]|nr:SEC-C metal-binding domain-containing protein [Candidatus Gastranaerophilales bacterium]